MSRSSLQAIYDRAKNAGLSYDPECVARKIAVESARGCASEHTALSNCLGVYYGTVPRGESCQDYITDCEQGHYCIVGEGGDGRCFEP